MKCYTVDFSGVKYALEFHEVLKKSLDFPDYYGMNRDAFWDCLTDICNDSQIIVKGIETLPKDLAEEAEVYIAMIEEARKEMPYLRYTVL